MEVEGSNTNHFTKTSKIQCNSFDTLEDLISLRIKSLNVKPEGTLETMHANSHFTLKRNKVLGIEKLC